MKLWWPRFSLRTLLVLVTLTCAYFAAWEITTRQGVAKLLSDRNREDVIYLTDVSDFFSPMPFVVGVTDVEYNLGRAPTNHHSLYFWFFGWTWETPIRWAVPGNPDEGDYMEPDRIYGGVI